MRASTRRGARSAFDAVHVAHRIDAARDSDRRHAVLSGLAATLESSVQRKRPTEPAPVITQLVTALGTSISNLTTGLAQMKQQGSQAMMQMLPQLMGR